MIFPSYVRRGVEGGGRICDKFGVTQSCKKTFLERDLIPFVMKLQPFLETVETKMQVQCKLFSFDQMMFKKSKCLFKLSNTFLEDILTCYEDNNQFFQIYKLCIKQAIFEQNAFRELQKQNFHQSYETRVWKRDYFPQ